MLGILKQAIFDSEGKLTLAQFAKFFGDKYYSVTILNSFKVTIAVTFLTLLIALPLSYFYTFYHIRGAKILFVVSILCSVYRRVCLDHAARPLRHHHEVL